MGLYLRPAREEFPPHRVRGARRGAAASLRPVRVPSAASAAASSASKGRGEVSEPKPFASLSSGLLARKGAARPAMRPQGFGQVGGNLEDLGWNDMGFEPPKPAEAPRDDDHDAFGEDIVEHPALHPSRPDAGQFAGPHAAGRNRRPLQRPTEDEAPRKPMRPPKS